MPNYYNANRGNDTSRPKYPQGDYNIYAGEEIEKEKVEKSSEDLIIDENSVYEIDQDCYERVRKNRLNQRQDWNKK